MLRAPPTRRDDRRLMTTPQTHVVFGAGQIGTPLAMLLRDQGHDVRLVRRSGEGPEGVHLIHGDAGDPTFVAGVSQDATAIYHCMNPAYDAKVWARELPRMLDALIAGAGRANARLV